MNGEKSYHTQASDKHEDANDEPNDHLGDSGPVDETDHGRDYRSLGNLAQKFDPGLYDPIRELCGSHLGIFAVCDYADFAIIQQTKTKIRSPAIAGAAPDNQRSRRIEQIGISDRGNCFIHTQIEPVTLLSLIRSSQVRETALRPHFPKVLYICFQPRDYFS